MVLGLEVALGFRRLACTFACRSHSLSNSVFCTRSCPLSEAITLGLAQRLPFSFSRPTTASARRLLAAQGIQELGIDLLPIAGCLGGSAGSDSDSGPGPFKGVVAISGELPANVTLRFSHSTPGFDAQLLSVSSAELLDHVEAAGSLCNGSVPDLSGLEGHELILSLSVPSAGGTSVIAVLDHEISESGAADDRSMDDRSDEPEPAVVSWTM